MLSIAGMIAPAFKEKKKKSHQLNKRSRQQHDKYLQFSHTPPQEWPMPETECADQDAQGH